MVMSGQSLVCFVCCFMSTVNSYGHVWTVICLLDVSLYVQGKQQWSCLDGHLFVWCVAVRHSKQLWSCLDSHLFV